MSKFKKELFKMCLSDKIRVFNELEGKKNESNGFIFGYGRYGVVKIHLPFYYVENYPNDVFEDLFDDIIANKSESELKGACRVLFE